MEKYEPIIEDIQEKHISTLDIAEFAQSSYNYESGTKKAIDEGTMTMKELEIYHYINAWTNHNIPFIDGAYEVERDAYNSTLQKAFLKTAEVYKIDENKARMIHDKVRKIPRVAQKN